MSRQMYNLEGTFVFGSDWFIPVHFGRQKKSVIDKARGGNITRFRQNYLCDWIGASDGALINISKLMKARTIKYPELRCPVDKKGNLQLCEYVIAVDVARSNEDSNNKTAIVVLKIIRSQSGIIRQVQIVNIITPPNGLNFGEQSLVIKKVFYKYGGNLNITKSRVKAIVIDANGLGQGVVEKLLENQTDDETNEELGCFATINTNEKSEDSNAPAMVYSLKAQGINTDVIRHFIDSVESNKLKLVGKFEDIKDEIGDFNESIEMEQICANMQFFIDEVANLKIKKTSSGITVEQVVRKTDKDRYSAVAYGLYYIFTFLEKEEEEDEDEILVFY